MDCAGVYGPAAEAGWFGSGSTFVVWLMSSQPPKYTWTSLPVPSGGIASPTGPTLSGSVCALRPWGLLGSTREAAKHGMVTTSPLTTPRSGISLPPIPPVRYVVAGWNSVEVVEAWNIRKNTRTLGAGVASA